MSELSLSLKGTWFEQLVPLTMLSVGIIVSFASAALLGWLMVCILGGLI
jgi:hypothetical protein